MNMVILPYVSTRILGGSNLRKVTNNQGVKPPDDWGQTKPDEGGQWDRNIHVLTVFTGRHTYVIRSWYSNPHTASTWNYMSVHAKGIIRFLGDSD